MTHAAQPNPFISALKLRRDHDALCCQEDGNDLASVLTARSRDAIVRSRALLARTGKMRGMKSREKPEPK
jgi:hypothetical protein